MMCKHATCWEKSMQISIIDASKKLKMLYKEVECHIFQVDNKNAVNAVSTESKASKKKFGLIITYRL